MNLAAICYMIGVLPSAISAVEVAKPPTFLLAGDSTSTRGAGWGGGFLDTLHAPAWGYDGASSGKTTVTYMSMGYWSSILKRAKNATADYDVYVTISFGHNDQNPKNNVTFAEYQDNLINMARQVQGIGATPLLTSSLSRRNFTSAHVETDSLHDQRLAAQLAANVTGSPFIDLNGASLWYVETIGEDAAQKYNYDNVGSTISNDTTHLNPWGAVVFGRMMSDLVIEALPGLSEYITPNKTLSHLIWSGVAA